MQTVVTKRQTHKSQDRLGEIRGMRRAVTGKQVSAEINKGTSKFYRYWQHSKETRCLKENEEPCTFEKAVGIKTTKKRWTCCG